MAITVVPGPGGGCCAFEPPRGNERWRSRQSERCVTHSYTVTLSTELAGSTTPAAATLFVASRLRMRWSELGCWSAEVADTRLPPWDCKSWTWNPHGSLLGCSTIELMIGLAIEAQRKSTGRRLSQRVTLVTPNRRGPLAAGTSLTKERCWSKRVGGARQIPSSG